MRHEKATEAPYKASYCIALAEEVHTIPETLGKPGTIDIADDVSLKKVWQYHFPVIQ